MRALMAGLLAYLFSATPAAASVIYCIGADGHTGFEIIAGASTGCDRCCHKPLQNGAPDDAQHEECVDIAMNGHAPTIAKKHDAGGTPDLLSVACCVATVAAPARLAPSRGIFVTRNAASPPSLPHRRAVVLQI